jgi:hypothetical protein
MLYPTVVNQIRAEQVNDDGSYKSFENVKGKENIKNNKKKKTEKGEGGASVNE